LLLLWILMREQLIQNKPLGWTPRQNNLLLLWIMREQLIQNKLLGWTPRQNNLLLLLSQVERERPAERIGQEALATGNLPVAWVLSTATLFVGRGNVPRWLVLLTTKRTLQTPHTYGLLSKSLQQLGTSPYVSKWPEPPWEC
jgi:hypothetical protein